jgi:hypothetical protein
MTHDCLGNVVSATGAATLRALDEFIEGYLAYETRAEDIVRAADADPECAIANVYAGYLWMFLESPQAAAHAAKYLAAAERTAPGATPRERANVAILRAWAEDDVPAALELCDGVTDQWPRDLVVLKVQQYFEFNRGNFPGLLRAALKVLPANEEVAYAHGMVAFGYEQCHRLPEAERAARHALELKRKEPWAQHALAHVLLTRGQIDEGARFLEDVGDTWTGLNSFMITHLWWHVALFNLSQGRFARALEVYDRHCWGVAKNYSQDQVGAISLLARLEIMGVEVGDRWQELADHLAARAEDTVLPFLSLQYLYGLARADRPQAPQLLQSIRRAAEEAPPHVREVWREVALPAAEGLYAHAHGDYETAWQRMGVALPRLIETGGSHAQRDLFDLVLVDSAIRAGHLLEAQQMLELRRAGDPDGVPVNEALARVYRDLRLPTLAQAASERAAATRSRHPA